MYTIMDYIKYYKDKDIKEVPWNMMDNLLCAILVYAPIKTDYSVKYFTTFCKECVNVKNIETPDAMLPKVKEVCSLLIDSKRYKYMRVVNYVNRVDENTQFGAATFILRNTKVISFKGTDTSVIGWIENFKLAYEYPTYTQRLAVNYLNNSVKLFDKNVYVVGHSKGGNLAMASVMESTNFVYNRIKRVINFDGPGFRKEEFNSLKYDRLARKLDNIIPSGSYVGVLMHNKNYQIVKSSSHAINVHYPTSWNSYGTVFIEGKALKMSDELHKMSTENIEKIDKESIKDVFETVFKTFDDKKTSKIHVSLADIKNILKNVKGKDKEAAKYVKIIITALFASSKKS